MFRRVIPAILLVLSGAASAMEVTTPFFQINLDDDWVQVEGDGPEQFVFRSDLRNAQITDSYIEVDAKVQDLERMSDKLLEFRLQAEKEAVVGREVFFSQPWSSRPDEQSLQISYFGRDSLDRHFFFSGFVTTTHITSVTGELEFSNQQALQAFYQKVLSNFGY